MANFLEIYKCQKCGNILKVVHAGVAIPYCCNEPMHLMTENTVDASKEKHVPVAEITNDGLLVKVGSVEHPMEEKHYIEWIEVIAENKVYTEYLKPGQKPQALFPIKPTTFKVREYCNLHGLWSWSKN